MGDKEGPEGFVDTEGVVEADEADEVVETDEEMRISRLNGRIEKNGTLEDSTDFANIVVQEVVNRFRTLVDIGNLGAMRIFDSLASPTSLKSAEGLLSDLPDEGSLKDAVQKDLLRGVNIQGNNLEAGDEFVDVVERSQPVIESEIKSVLLSLKLTIVDSLSEDHVRKMNAKLCKVQYPERILSQEKLLEKLLLVAKEYRGTKEDDLAPVLRKAKRRSIGTEELFDESDLAWIVDFYDEKRDRIKQGGSTARGAASKLERWTTHFRREDVDATRAFFVNPLRDRIKKIISRAKEDPFFNVVAGGGEVIEGLGKLVSEDDGSDDRALASKFNDLIVKRDGVSLDDVAMLGNLIGNIDVADIMQSEDFKEHVAGLFIGEAARLQLERLLSQEIETEDEVRVVSVESFKNAVFGVNTAAEGLFGGKEDGEKPFTYFIRMCEALSSKDSGFDADTGSKKLLRSQLINFRKAVLGVQNKESSPYGISDSDPNVKKWFVKMIWEIPTIRNKVLVKNGVGSTKGVTLSLVEKWLNENESDTLMALAIGINRLAHKLI